MRAVLTPTTHIHPLKEMVDVDKIINVGNRKEPSKEAIDKFIEIYLEIVSRSNIEKGGSIKSVPRIVEAMKGGDPNDQ